MSLKTYRIIGSTLAIPGIPGEWHHGQEVDVDEETMTVMATRLMDTPPVLPETLIITGTVNGTANVSEAIPITGNATHYSSNFYEALGRTEDEDQTDQKTEPQENEGDDA